MIETQIIETKSDSICFLKKYYRDFKENGDKWENISLENFLKSLVTYTEDIDGYYANINKNELIGKATWRTFADILSGAAVYE